MIQCYTVCDQILYQINYIVWFLMDFNFIFLILDLYLLISDISRFLRCSQNEWGIKSITLDESLDKSLFCFGGAGGDVELSEVGNW